MKKFFLLLAGVTMVASSAMAQMSLVKEAEKVIGGKKIKIMHVNPDGSTTVIKISY